MNNLDWVTLDHIEERLRKDARKLTWQLVIFTALVILGGYLAYRFFVGQSSAYGMIGAVMAWMLSGTAFLGG